MYQSDLKDIITEVAKSDLQYKELVAKLQQGNLQQKIEEYKLDNDEILMYRGKIYVRNSQELKNIILREIHTVPYAAPRISENYCSCQKPILLVRHKERGC
jgi:hypothetical protein